LNKNWIAELGGEYRGRAEGSEFNLRLRRAEREVEATVDWLGSPPEYHVRLLGVIKDDHVAMRYWRNARHPNGADKGEALMYPTDTPGQFTGRWYSFDVRGREEDWVLSKISDNVSLVDGELPWGEAEDRQCTEDRVQDEPQVRPAISKKPLSWVAAIILIAVLVYFLA